MAIGATAMITLYAATPDSHKAAIALDEPELRYTLGLVELSAGEQHRSERRVH